jgi:hypothetical protein
VSQFKSILVVGVAMMAPGISHLSAQTSGTPVGAQIASKTYDPHDLSGVWRLPMTPKSNLLFKSPDPEPPLTDWAKSHMFPGGITHGDKPTISGGFPGQNCDPIGVPAQFAYLRFYPMEIIQFPNRIMQVFELHREWRNIWIGDKHPEDLNPTYSADSVAKWEGNTLVVDTIGFNGKDFITEDIPHPMSKDFHLVERYSRPSYDTLKIEMTFSDPKAWGDKSWTGFTRVLKLQTERLQDWTCAPEADEHFNQQIMAPAYGSTGLNMPKTTTPPPPPPPHQQ